MVQRGGSGLDGVAAPEGTTHAFFDGLDGRASHRQLQPEAAVEGLERFVAFLALGELRPFSLEALSDFFDGGEGAILETFEEGEDGLVGVERGMSFFGNPGGVLLEKIVGTWCDTEHWEPPGLLPKSVLGDQ